MSSDLATLRPSTAPAIPLEVLRDLPLMGIYIGRFEEDDGGDRPFRIREWVEPNRPICTYLSPGDDVPTRQLWLAADEYEIFYPLLPGMFFRETKDKVADGSKIVTRRKTCPKWCRPGALFMAWDRSHRAGKGLARGLGVHRVVSVGHVDRDGKIEGGLGGYFIWTPEELRREGFADMDPGEFWKMLEGMGAVVDGKTWRISFAKM